MVWFFERDQEHITLETRYDNATREYLLIVRRAGVADQHERFQTVQAFHQRLLTLERQLEADHWQGQSPVILPDGWPDRPPDT